MKLFDERLLIASLEALEAQLAAVRVIDQGALTQALGRIQGASISTSSIGITATGLPTAKVGTETSGTSKLTTGSETSTSESTETAAATPTTPTTKSSETTKDTSGSDASITTKRTSETPSVGPAVPAAPVGTSLYSTGPAIGLASQDLLTEQLNLSYQLLNLRMLLARAVSDRYLSEDIQWASGAKSQFSSVKGQTVLGFQISIDSRHRYKDAVAEVEVTMLPGGNWLYFDEYEAMRKAPPDPKGPKAARYRELKVLAATCKVPAAPVSLVSLLPREKTYNVATLTRKAMSIGFGAVVQVVNVGFTASRSRETMYLVKDTDTVALQRPPAADGVAFAWQFRPVLGRRVVEPGLRDTYAMIALPVPAECGYVGKLKIQTRWRKYDRDTGAIKDVIENTSTSAERTLAVPAFSGLDNALRPKITRLEWTDAGAGQIVAWTEGEAFLSGTGVVLGDTAYGAGSAAFAKQGETRWRLSLPAAKLAQVNDAHLIGQYGTPTAIREAGLQNDQIDPKLPVLSIAETSVEPSGADRATVKVALKSASKLPYVPSDKHPPVVLIGAKLFGLSDALVAMARDKNIKGDNEPGTTTLTFKAPADLIAANDLVTVLELFRGPNYRATHALHQREVFSPTRVDVLTANDTEVSLGIIGSGFNDDAVVIANDQEFSKPNNKLTRRGSGLLTFKVPKTVAASLKQVLVMQGQARPKLLPYPAPAAQKPAVASVGSIAQGDSKWVAIAGSNLASIRTVLFDGKTRLQVEADAGGSSLRVFVTAEVTATAGEKQLELSNPAGDRVSCVLKVDPK